MTTRTAVPRYRPYQGPALFRQGFRPFFLAAGLTGAVMVPLWLLVFEGRIALPTAFDLAGWHAHEMIFGFAGAAIAGFLLTAIPNWTGRLPLQGGPLALLAGCWLAGRLVLPFSALTGPALAAVVDLSFPVLLLAVTLREIVAGGNWRNLPMPIALLVLIAANLMTHLAAAGVAEVGRAGERLGIAAILLLISLIGGRIIPSFTRNWLAKRNSVGLPAPFGRFDKLCLALTLAGLAAWVAVPEHPVTGALLLAAAAVNAARLARWRGLSTLTEPLVWSLHLAFAWLPVGFCLLGLGVFLPDALPAAAGLHALTAGAIASMMLAVMTRATLGHSGRALAADRRTTAIYLAVALAAALRVVASLDPEAYLSLLWASGLLWTVAFGLFCLHYGAMHLTTSAAPEQRA